MPVDTVHSSLMRLDVLVLSDLGPRRSAFFKNGQCHEILASGNLWITFPKALKTTLGSFRIFWKFASQGAPPASTTPVANLPPVSTTPAANFATGTGVNDSGGKLPPVSTTPAANLPLVSTTYWEQYQAADTLRWTWRQKFIFMLTLQYYPKVFQ
jgi:hypothetical protein